MSETTDPHGGAPAVRTHDYATAAAITPGGSSLLRLGGALGIAACCVGLAVLVLGCLGVGQAMALSIIPVALSAPGLVISIVGAITQKRAITEDTSVLHALFVNLAGLIGGMLEMAVWREWPIFAR